MQPGEPDDADRRVLRDIEEHGWHAVQVVDDDPAPFICSVGVMQTLKRPELVIFGLEIQLMHRVLWTLYREIKMGRRFDDEPLHDRILVGYPVAARIAHRSWHPRYLGYAMWHR